MTAAEKRRARSRVQYVVKKGALMRGECEAGGECDGLIHAHHDDYSKPFDVRWLCTRHHYELHRNQASRVQPAPLVVRDASALSRERAARLLSPPVSMKTLERWEKGLTRCPDWRRQQLELLNRPVRAKARS